MVKDNFRKAVVYMIISSFSFAIMQLMLKLAGDIPYFEKVFFRNLVGLVFAFYLIKKKNVSLLGSKRNFKALFFRGLCGTLGMVLYVYSVNLLPMADASMFNRISPFFVMIFAAVLLKEKIDRIKVISLLGAFSGILLIIRPDLSLDMIPTLCGLLSAVFAGMAYTLVRYLKGKEDPLTVIFFFSLFSTSTMFLPTIITFTMLDAIQWMYLLGIGLFALGGQYFLTLAYQYAPAGEISIYSYSMVIFSVLLGIVIFNEIPNVLVVVGMIFVILSAMLLYLNETGRLKRYVFRQEGSHYAAKLAILDSTIVPQEQTGNSEVH